jgi:hypothetical protein
MHNANAPARKNPMTRYLHAASLRDAPFEAIRAPLLALLLATMLVVSPRVHADERDAGFGKAVDAHAAMSDAGQAWGFGSVPMLAGLGLLAVAAGAATVRRPRSRARCRARGAYGVAMPTDRLPLLTIASEPAPPSTCHARSTMLMDEEMCEPEPPHGTAEARAYLALHHVDLAIGVLREHVDREPRAMPVAWLMLLDLYRTHGREQAFRELAARFHERFNAQTPEWGDYPPDVSEPGLEAFPRLIKEISLCWGTHECRRLLDRLLHDNRNGRRRGFTLNAYNDLLALRRLSDELLTTIEADFAEEAKLRSAFANATANLEPGEQFLGAESRGGNAEFGTSPDERPALATELVSQLEDDLRSGGDTRSALEIEHPALAGMLAREWGNSALAARLCTILVQGAESSTQPLSPQAAADLETLGLVAAELANRTTHPMPGG